MDDTRDQRGENERRHDHFDEPQEDVGDHLEPFVRLGDRLGRHRIVNDRADDGICATKKIKEEFPETKVIAFTMFEQNDAIEQMMFAGASGYVVKNSSLNKVIEAIRAVARNEKYFDDSVHSKDDISHEEIILSNREKEILKLVGEGKTSNEISTLLGIGKSTVDTHRKNIIKKINLHGKTELLRFAVERKYDF